MKNRIMLDKSGDSGKVRALRVAWGDEVPNFVFYYMPPGAVINMTEFVRDLFAGELPGHDAVVMLHLVNGFADSGLQMPIWMEEGTLFFNILRIHGAKALGTPLALDCGGVRCPLVQFGHVKDLDVVGEDGKTQKCVSFIFAPDTDD